MGHGPAEGRRMACVSGETAVIMALHVAMPVRLLGLTSDGLLLACQVPLRIGSTVRVAAELAGQRLDVELCVDHVSNRPDEAVGGYVLRGRMPSFEPAAWRRITTLMGKKVTGPGDERTSWAA